MRALPILAVSALAACAGSLGPAAEPSARPATIVAARTKALSVRVAAVDDRVAGDSYRGYPDEVEIPPGPRRIKLHLSGRVRAVAFRELAFPAREGGRYAVRFDPASVTAPDVAVWIEDAASGALVAGEKPSAPAEAAAPLMEASLPRGEWRSIAPGTRLKIVLNSGEPLIGRFVSYGGGYLWATLDSGDRRAWHQSEIGKVSVLSPAR